MEKQSRTQTHETITLWTNQLYLEHERICFDRKIHLPKVSIRIQQLPKASLGSWDEHTQCISIATRLIEDYCWSVVLEVLKHEMAHQLISETIGKPSAPHGKEFQKACIQLGVSQWARQAHLNIDQLNESLSPHLSQKEESILRKAKKLLALAQSSNQNEASIAMDKVQTLYEKFHLTSLKDLEKPEFCTTLINHRKRRTEVYQTMIGSLLVKHFYVQVIHNELFDKNSLTHHKTIEIIGLPRHVKLAEYVYWFIFNNLPPLWKEYQKQYGKKGLKSRNNYFQGVISGFGEKLEKSKINRSIKQDHNKETQELLVQENTRLLEYLYFRHPRISRTSYSRGCDDADSYQAGKEKGRELNLHEGLNERKSYSGLKLPPSSTT